MTSTGLWHQYKARFILLIVSMLMLLITFFLELTGIIYTNWNGCGVDSAGQVYIGGKNKILVFQEGEQVNTIYLPNFRSYMFTLTNDQIVLSSGAMKYTFDLQGNELASEDDYGGRYYAQLTEMSRFTGGDGKRYSVTESAGIYKVRRSGATIVYSTPVIVAILSAMSTISVILFIVSVTLVTPIIRKWLS